MPTIKIHLDDEEYAPVHRLAADLGLTPETIAYAALNRLMLHGTEDEVLADISATHLWKGTSLPSWSDSARSVHAYEGKADEHSEPHR